MFLKLLGATGAAVRFAEGGGGKTVRIVEFSPTGARTGVTNVEKVEKPEAEWRKQLTPEAFDVTRKAGTEPPFTGKYAANHADGLYTCICCNTFLFDSKTKFESGTGWPAFDSRSPKRTSPCGETRRTAWFAMRCCAAAVTPTWAMYSMTHRRRLTSGTA